MEKHVFVLLKLFVRMKNQDLTTTYQKRPPIEAVNSFLKTQFSMANNKVGRMVIPKIGQ